MAGELVSSVRKFDFSGLEGAYCVPYSSSRKLIGTRDQFRGREFFHRLGGGVMAQAVMRAMGTADEALLPPPPLTSRCASWFLTGRGPVWSMAWALGTPALQHVLLLCSPAWQVHVVHFWEMRHNPQIQRAYLTLCSLNI